MSVFRFSFLVWRPFGFIAYRTDNQFREQQFWHLARASSNYLVATRQQKDSNPYYQRSSLNRSESPKQRSSFTGKRDSLSDRCERLEKVSQFPKSNQTYLLFTYSLTEIFFKTILWSVTLVMGIPQTIHLHNNQTN